MSNHLVCRTDPETEESCSEADSVLANQGPDRSADGRLMYYEHQVQRREDYRGPLDQVSDDEARAMLLELARFSNFCCDHDFPLPPAGLPGLLHAKYDRDERAAYILATGIRYVGAIIRNERKSMHNRWEEARSFITDLEERVEARVREECFAAGLKGHADRQAKARKRRRVYFIGAESGPIKIGIATNPKTRLKELQTSHHERLSLLVTIAGDADLEKSYHRQFAAHRLHGEWFSRCPAIEAEITRLNQGTPRHAQ